MRAVRCFVLVAAFAGLMCGRRLYASDSTPVDATIVRALADKAHNAKQRDQCYLYAKLVRDTTELADRDVAAGNSSEAASALVAVQKYSADLTVALAKDAKKLKDAEILLRESAFRLRGAMMASSLSERPAMAAALAKINTAEANVMGMVFAH